MPFQGHAEDRDATLQTAEQPSPPARLPSSHCSSPSTIPLPHSVSQRTTCSNRRGHTDDGKGFRA